MSMCELGGVGKSMLERGGVEGSLDFLLISLKFGVAS